MNLAANFPIILAGVISVLGTLLIIFIGFLIHANKNREMTIDEQVESLLEDNEWQEETSTKVTLIKRWNNYWGRLFKAAGIERYAGNNAKAGREVVLAGVGLSVVLSVIIQNVFAGFGITIALIFGISVLLKTQSNRKEAKVNDQLTGFLYAVQANLQANETPERAILKISDAMPSPLRENLMVLKNRLASGSSFIEGLEEMSKKTSSQDLKFLAACLIMSASTGANMESQIDKIQNVLKKRKEINAKIQESVKGATPVIWLTSLALPVIFLASYSFDVSSKGFWFTSLVSWVVLVVVVILYILGIFGVKRRVDAVRNI